MKVLVLQHERFEGVGNMQAWLDAKSAQVDYVRLYEPNPVFPEAADYELVIVLGGIMSANDEDKFPWLVEEKGFIQRVVEADVPLLGICLGAQLIACALGAKVTLNKESEIGWFEVARVVSDAEPVFQFPERMTVFHWHGETFALPEGAVRLLESEACANQGFQLGDKVIGLQCHLEVVLPTINQWLADAGELEVKPFVQTAQKMREGAPAFVPKAESVLAQVLDYLTR